MPQKVISVTVRMITGSREGLFVEHDSPAVTAALDEGYKVEQIHSAVSDSANFMNITFVLQKDTPRAPVKAY